MIRFLGTVALFMSGSFVFDSPEASECFRNLMDRVGRQATCMNQSTALSTYTSTLPQDDEGGGQMSVD